MFEEGYSLAVGEWIGGGVEARLELGWPLQVYFQNRKVMHQNDVKGWLCLTEDWQHQKSERRLWEGELVK